MKQNKGHIHGKLYYKYVDTERAVFHKTNEISIHESDWQDCKNYGVDWITFIDVNLGKRFDLAMDKALEYVNVRPSFQGDVQAYWNLGLFNVTDYD